MNSEVLLEALSSVESNRITGIDSRERRSVPNWSANAKKGAESAPTKRGAATSGGASGAKKATQQGVLRSRENASGVEPRTRATMHVCAAQTPSERGRRRGGTPVA